MLKLFDHKDRFEMQWTDIASLVALALGCGLLVLTSLRLLRAQFFRWGIVTALGSALVVGSVFYLTDPAMPGYDARVKALTQRVKTLEASVQASMASE